mmetsp:Transcript_6547/g.18335  ORF Transcript_6547/g.18335 Transcript_6547/m.18335 type:complete len:112 (-) Transcript_6547:388-723(-)
MATLAFVVNPILDLFLIYLCVAVVNIVWVCLLAVRIVILARRVVGLAWSKRQKKKAQIFELWDFACIMDARRSSHHLYLREISANAAKKLRWFEPTSMGISKRCLGVLVWF